MRSVACFTGKVFYYIKLTYETLSYDLFLEQFADPRKTATNYSNICTASAKDEDMVRRVRKTWRGADALLTIKIKCM